MHVGYRLKDWSDVWYEPASEPDIEGEAKIGPFKLTTGEPGRRELYEGEVAWHPPFDEKRCESSKYSDKKKMQKQFLTDAYLYLAEKDLEIVRQMEEDLDQPSFSRWQAWFSQARKWKKKKRIAKEAARRRRRRKVVRDGGMSEAEIEENSDSESSDSAYESDGMESGSIEARKSGMPPPKQRPTKANGKRIATKKGSGSRKSGPKKPKLNGDVAPRRPNRLQNSFSLFVSDDDDDESLDYDIRPPQGLEEESQDDTVDDHNPGIFPTPQNTQDQAHTRAITPFAQWGRISQRNGSVLEDGTPTRTKQRRVEGQTGSDDVERANRISEINGEGIDEEQAVQEALRQSIEPSEEPSRMPGNGDPEPHRPAEDDGGKDEGTGDE